MDIDGVLLTPLRQILDERGAVLHMMRTDAPGFLGFGECYFSEIAPGKVKAWKMHTRQTQNLAAPVGRVRLVMVDLRENSCTRGHIMDIELSRPDHYHRVTVPPGIWYGFACVSPHAALLVHCGDLPHDPAESITADLSDSRLPEVWVHFK